jgi:hypothetical protein
MSHDTDQPLLNVSRAALDERAAALDFATVSRLNQARQRALAQLRTRPRIAAWRWAPAFGATAAAALLLALVLNRSVPPVEPATGAIADLELLIDADTAIAEQLSFYEWASVALNEEAPDAPTSG